MSRYHGRNFRLYVDLNNSGVATLVPFVKSWTRDGSVDRADVTAFGDENKATVAGLPDAKGNYAGFADDSTGQFYAAASDGASRRVYAYINLAGAPTKYEYGFAFFDESSDWAVDAGASISGTWSADGPWRKSF